MLSVMGPATPITHHDLRATFGRLFDGPLALAVSGGVDSVALMHLVADWLGVSAPEHARAPAPIVLTVDHGLRPEAAGEAAWVAQEAAKIGFEHATLAWRGPKPASGLQSAARAARYGLINDFLEAEARDGRVARKRSLVTAHHANDQAETFLMRLARGSGLDGLSAMRERERLRRPGGETTRIGLTLLRPLLTVPKERLVATLEARGLAWCEDPSNAMHSFERTRVRDALRSLSGLGIGSEQIAASANRLARARAAVGARLAELAPGLVHLHHGLLAEVDTEQLRQVAGEFQVRILAALIRAYGGAAACARLSQVEALVCDMERAGAGERVARTLGGCRIEGQMGGPVRLWRELGRAGLEDVRLEPGAYLLWDRRFGVALAAEGRQAVQVRALGPNGRRELACALTQAGRPAAPDRGSAAAAETLPSFWRGPQLVAVPYFGPLSDDARHCSAEFVAEAGLWELG